MLIPARCLTHLRKIGRDAKFFFGYFLALFLYFSILGLALIAVVIGLLRRWLRLKAAND